MCSSIHYTILMLFQVVWCVARKTNSTGQLNPLDYEEVLVNEGNAWNISSNTVVIPHTGYYLVHFAVGIPANTIAVYNLYVGGSEMITSLYRGRTEHNGTDTIGKTILRKFRADDVLHVKTNYNTFSDSRLLTNFMGLLLYEG